MKILGARGARIVKRKRNPKGSRVARCVRDLKARKSPVRSPYAVCQAATGQSYRTGRRVNPVGTMYSSSSAGVRASPKMLEKRVGELAHVLHLPTVKFVAGAGFTVGAIGLQKVFPTRWRLYQHTSEGGAERDLSASLTAGEMLAFLDGALMVARAAR